MNRGIPFIISGPSGAGKTTLYKLALEKIPNVRHSVSYTTRPPRPGDVDGLDYNFVTEEVFNEMIEAKEFIEHAHIHGNRYGTARADLDGLLSSGSHVLLEIDVQGAQSMRKTLEAGVYVFIAPPSMEVCEQRLSSRGKDSPEVIARRVDAAMEEINHAPAYDYIIINDRLEEAFEGLKAIITAEASRSARVMAKIIENFPL